MELDLERENQATGIRIKILGVGGAGGNVINTMIENSINGVEFISAHTNINNFKNSRAKIKLQLGKETTKGLGTGAKPELGALAAEESREAIKEILQDANLLIITAGMGGGTGTGAAPIIASVAKELEILTIAIVTKPFRREGKKRLANAEKGIQELTEIVDTIIVIPNEKINELFADLTLIDAFNKVNNIIYEAAKAISDIITYAGYISVDYADIKTIMSNRGFALMGTGIAEGENRAEEAAKAAMSNPLLKDLIMKNAKGILINITASKELKMSEFDKINEIITEETGDDGDIIIGTIIDDGMEEKIKVTLIATGLQLPGGRIQEIEKMRKSGNLNEENIDEALERIRISENLDLQKKAEPEHNHKPKMSSPTEIPAFMRKFSN